MRNTNKEFSEIPSEMGKNEIIQSILVHLKVHPIEIAGDD